MYTLTHTEGDPVQWHNAIVPLEPAFRITENTKNGLIQLLYLATGKDMFSCCSGWGVDGFILRNHGG